jgi:hypothetical protein
MEPLKKGQSPGSGARVTRLTPERFLEAASKRFMRERPDRCSKCGSTFMCHEPAFVHCRYCGKIARIANASLADQEIFEIRSGLRLAC